MNAVHLALSTTLLLAVVGCGSDATDPATPTASVPPAVSAADSASTASGRPDVPERYRRTLARAFDTAREGRSPTMACTSVIALAAGNPAAEGATPDPDGVRAFELCYIDVAARYIETLLAQITPATGSDATNDICARIASYAIISRTSLGSFADNVHLKIADLDARRLQRVEPGMRSHCPDRVASMSGYD